MRIKKYLAKSMREALLQIKEDLGENAIILNTRKVPKKMFTLGAHDEIEVTAAVDEDKAKSTSFPPLRVTDPGVYGRPRKSMSSPSVAPALPPIPPSAPAQQLRSSLSPRVRIPPIVDRRIDKEPLEPAKDRREQPEYAEIKENIRELRDLVKNAIENGGNATAGGFSGGWAILYNRMVDSEVKPQIAARLINSVRGTDIATDAHAEKKFIAALAAGFPVAGPLKLRKNSPVVVAFVGPTGSGKTTTLAKLAAHCCLNKQKTVSIITADTYRIAAIEQIRMFADIVKVGLQVVFSPDEIAGALESCAGDDVVLVDTAGRSQRNLEHMEDLKEMLAVLRPDETHLVLSATTKDSDLLDMIQRYRGMEINRLLFTKLDETVQLGNIFNTVSESAIPVSYFTFGQSVPDDIELAQPARFVQRLWDGRAL